LQVVGRATILGRAVQLADKDALGPRYLRFHPQAEAYFAMHDFQFWRIEPVRVRWIGGFGRIHWVEPAEYQVANTLPEQDILAHMNADHADSLIHYCRHVHGKDVNQAEMIGIDPDGFDLRADQEHLRFDFETPVTDAAGARTALVNLAQAARR
jgi:putative heme iron utilization protein